jgi:hypothetical protein
MVEPGEPVRRDRHGRHWQASSRGDFGEPPGVAGLPRFKEEVVVEPDGIVRGAGVFKEDKAGH